MDSPQASSRWWTHAERDPIHESAADWFARMQDPALSVEETASWQAWLREDPRHVQAYQRIEEVWAAAHRIEDRGGDEATYDYNIPIGQWVERRASRHRVMRWTAWSAAATLAVAAAGWLWLAASPLRIETGVGENRTVALADGSRVELGGATSLRVRLGQTRREIELSRGEALFTVAKDPTRPFEVHVGRATVTAVGTAFNIRRVSERVVIAVLDGNVKITGGDNTPSVPLAAGEETVVTRSRVAAAVRLASSASATAWTSGRLSFDQERLQDALEVVNRYASKPIVAADDSVGHLQITGAVLSDNIGAWILSLESAFGLEAVEMPDHIELRQLAP